jgi:hypothetical protein
MEPDETFCACRLHCVRSELCSRCCGEPQERLTEAQEMALLIKKLLSSEWEGLRGGDVKRN